MIEKEIIVELQDGLQARSASHFVQEANRFAADIFIDKENKRINAKSIMGLMSLAIANDEKITLIVDGEDEEEVMEHLLLLLQEKV